MQILRPTQGESKKKYSSRPAWSSTSSFLQHLCSQSANFFGTLAAEVLQSAKFAFPSSARVPKNNDSRPAWECDFRNLQHLCSESASFAAQAVGIWGLGSTATLCQIAGDLCLIMCYRPFTLRVSLHIRHLQASTSYHMSHKVSHFSQACTTTLTQMMLPMKFYFTNKVEQPCSRL